MGNVSLEILLYKVVYRITGLPEVNNLLCVSTRTACEFNIFYWCTKLYNVTATTWVKSRHFDIYWTSTYIHLVV